jgi:16S rRNA (cytosine967-C5)-methyltransferase
MDAALAAPFPLSARERALALEALQRVRAPGSREFATSALAALFRRERGLSGGERARIADAVATALRWERRLDAILAAERGGRARPAPRRRFEQQLLVAELRAGVEPAALRRELARAFGAAPDLAALLGAEAGLAGLRGLEREAVRHSLPTWLLARLAAELGRDAALALAEASNARPPVVLRANRLRTSREALLARLAERGVAAHPTRLSRDGIALESAVDRFALPEFREGLFEQMDEGSQLVAEVTAPPPRGELLDACAGAGGKTLALAALLGGRGRVLALDVDARRLDELRRRARRAGASNVAARRILGGRLPPEVSPTRRSGGHRGFDRVLVDAPCSGSGTLRRNPEARWRLSEAELDTFPARQLELLATYAPRVAPGGRLIYATCSVLPSENDAVVEAFLREAPDFARVPLKEVLGRARAEALGDGTWLRLLPQVHGTDGFTAAVLRRAGRARAASTRQAGLK